MKYFIRSVKYFFYLIAILAIIVAVMILAGFVEADLSKIFINGYDSLWQIALIMAVFAAIYPRFGFSSRMAHVGDSPEEIGAAITKVMDLQGYKLEKTLDGGTKCFIRRSPLSRAVKMFEDRISITPCAGGLEVEGLTRDLVRVVSGLEAALRSDEADV